MENLRDTYWKQMYANTSKLSHCIPFKHSDHNQTPAHSPTDFILKFLYSQLGLGCVSQSTVDIIGLHYLLRFTMLSEMQSWASWQHLLYMWRLKCCTGNVYTHRQFISVAIWDNTEGTMSKNKSRCGKPCYQGVFVRRNIHCCRCQAFTMLDSMFQVLYF